MFITLGHSQLAERELLDLLTGAGVTRVVDVRKLPGSRAYPHTNQERLEVALPAQDIAYEHSPGLAGRRTKSREISPAVNGLWRNQSFHNYADYALTEPFGRALDELREHEGTIAIMCSEAVWWRCHRRIIADYLLCHSEPVVHLFPAGNTAPAKLTAGAVCHEGKVTYPASPSPPLT